MGMNKILITGSSRGIGFELTRQILRKDHFVFATCRNPDSAHELKLLHNQYPNRLTILKLNVEDEDSVQSCFKQMEQDGESIDTLFNNAGIIDWSNLEQIEAIALEKIYKVNLLGALLVTRHSIPVLQGSDSPLIVNLSSRLGSIELRGGTKLGGAIAYQCSKAALNMLTKQTSIDLEPYNIRVISQSPGWVKTEMGGNEAKYETTEAVTMMLDSLEKLPQDKTGIFIGEDGKEIPW